MSPPRKRLFAFEVNRIGESGSTWGEKGLERGGQRVRVKWGGSCNVMNK